MSTSGFISRLQKDTARAWGEFENFYYHEFSDSGMEFARFTALPAEMQAGVLLAFLESESVEIDMVAFRRNDLVPAITEGFITLEDMITHYS